MSKYLPILEVEPNELPSKSLPYPSGAKVAYRPYTFGELKQLEQSRMGESARIQYILKGIETSFESSFLTVPDFIYVSMLRKFSSLGTSEYELKGSCYQCGAQLRSQFKAKDIEFHDLDVPALPLIVLIKLGEDKKELHFGPLTVANYLKLQDEKKTDDDVAVLARQVVNLSPREALEVISNATGDDMEVLNIISEKLFHGVKPMVRNCQECDAVNRFDIENLNTLVFPFRPDIKSLEGRIRFGAGVSD